MRLPPPGQRPVDHAHQYADRGWPVFPCHHPATTGCSCGHDDCSNVAKHPRITGGFHRATLDHEQIDTWWRRWPFANIGIATGAPSGLLVIDIDPAHGGLDAIRNLQARHGNLPKTYTVKTGGGGWHLYFTDPDRPVLRNSAGRLGPGLDIRANGGYILAPPSLHRSGGAYAVRLPAEVEPPPRWLSVRCVPAPVRRVDLQSARTAGSIDDLCHMVATAQEGSRNTTLYAAALGVKSAGGARRLVAAAIDAGLTADEARSTVQSAGRGLAARGGNPVRAVQPTVGP